MPNRRILELNNIFRNIDAYEKHISKRYISDFSGSKILFEDYETIKLTDINMYHKIKSLEVFSDSENVTEVFRKAAGTLISSAGNASKALAMVFYSSPQNDVSVYIGTNCLVADELIDNFKKKFNDCETKTEWIPKGQLSAVQTYCGVINSPANIELGDINNVLRASDGHFMISFVLVPCDQYELKNNIDIINKHIEEYQNISHRSTTIGSIRNNSFENENQKIKSLLKTLQQEKERLEKGLNEGLFQTLIYVCAQEEKTYRKVSAGILSALNNSTDTKKHSAPSTCLEIRNKLIDKTIWEIPVSSWDSVEIQGLTLFDSSFVNLYTAEEATSLFFLPTDSFSDYRINFYGKAKDKYYFFDRTFEERTGKTIIMGDVIDGSKNYPLRLNDFKTHTFVVGATQTGKSTTTRKIVYEMLRNDVPVIIIEPAKSDYWKLKKVIGTGSLKVYSFKNDAENLYFNPFKPEEGVLIDTHIQSLTQALISMFDEEDPLPQLIQKLVYYCYEKKGIDISIRAKESDTFDYPTFNDMLNFVEPCINETYSEGEINNNMKDVLKVRLGSLVKGNVGKVLNSKHSISIKDMFGTSSIVELDGLNDYTQAFLTAIITTRVNEYVRRQGESNEIKRLLVIEEAHNLMPSIAKSSSKTQKMMSQYFVKMLAEISSTGTGIIIVDQRPSEISDAALANTSIKICHALREKNDKNAVANSISLSEHQTERFSSLKVGETIIKSASHADVCIVKINGNLPYNKWANCACVFCNNQNYCESSREFISEFDRNYVKSYGADEKTLLKALRTIEDRYFYESLSYSQKMCIAGNLLASYEQNDIVSREVLYSLSEILKNE